MQHGVTTDLLARLSELERRLRTAQEAKREARRQRDLWRQRALENAHDAQLHRNTTASLTRLAERTPR